MAVTNMNLCALLTAENLLEQSALEDALALQKANGGDLKKHLLDIGAIQNDKLEELLSRQPRQPASLEETGLSRSFLIGLTLKIMYLNGAGSISSLVEELKLPYAIVEGLVEYIRERQFIEPLGSSARPEQLFDVHFALSKSGTERALEEIEQSAYVGPAPVPVAAFEAQVRKQSLSTEQLDQEKLFRCLSDLIVPTELANRIGTALNSRKPILMYGPPGNGKSSISRAAARGFRQMIYLPRCIEVDGQVIKIFDPTIHDEISLDTGSGEHAKARVLRQDNHDDRWVCCHRPFVSTGVELTLDMLDLNFHPRAHFYDAPLQMKACGGVLFINDFGKQLARPIDILNRWVVPLEHGADYFTLETGRKFGCVFDTQLVFSTNLPLEKVMGSEILRRIPYRIQVEPPSQSEFIELFQRECAARNIELTQELRTFVVAELYGDENRQFARYHPRFFVDHAVAKSKFRQQPLRLDRDVLTEAMQDLFTRD